MKMSLKSWKVSEYFQKQEKLTAVLTPVAPPWCLKSMKQNQIINLRAEKDTNTVDQEIHPGRIDYTVISWWKLAHKEVYSTDLCLLFYISTHRNQQQQQSPKKKKKKSMLGFTFLTWFKTNLKLLVIVSAAPPLKTLFSEERETSPIPKDQGFAASTRSPG